MAEREDLNFIEILLKTGTDDCWPDDTYLIVLILNMIGEVIWKNKYQTSDEHPEIQMLKDDGFKDKVKKRKAGAAEKVTIILTSNHSPCYKCADELITFFNGRKSLKDKFIIQFSRPFRTDEELNQNGLRNLDMAGIILEGMTSKCWFSVMIQYMFDLEPDKVSKRDYDTRERLDELLADDSEDSEDDSEDSESD